MSGRGLGKKWTAGGARLAVLALWLAAGPAWGQAFDQGRATVGRDAANSTARFIAHCEIPDHHSFCDGYLLGAATTMTQPPLCLSESYATERYRIDFIAWVQARPEMLDMMTVLSVIRFLQDSYRCPATPATGRGI